MNQQNQTAPQTAAPKVFTTINAAELLKQEYELLQFAIDKILPHGIFVFAGSPKIGNYRRYIVIVTFPFICTKNPARPPSPPGGR
jgi:hypothetical protein